MSKLSQGTMIYFLDPADDSVVEVECATAFNPGGSPRDNLDDTCLRDTTAKSKGGLRRPGQATLGINADPEYASHVRLFQLFEGDEDINLKWAVGWSDGTAVPTVGKPVASVTIGAGGTGYTGTPTVAFTAAPAGGVTALGTVQTSAGVVTGITITEPGSGYLVAPTATITGAGTGATATAVLGDADFVFPSTRTFFTFEGYVSDFPFDFGLNALVTSTVTVQRSGPGAWLVKTP